MPAICPAWRCRSNVPHTEVCQGGVRARAAAVEHRRLPQQPTNRAWPVRCSRRATTRNPVRVRGPDGSIHKQLTITPRPTREGVIGNTDARAGTLTWRFPRLSCSPRWHLPPSAVTSYGRTTGSMPATHYARNTSTPAKDGVLRLTRSARRRPMPTSRSCSPSPAATSAPTSVLGHSHTAKWSKRPR